MSLVALKCPNCGADLELEGTKEFAFCMHCGTKILIQEMVGRNSGSESSKLKNLEDLALTSIGSSPSSELRDLSLKILEIDSKNWIGWFARGVAEAKKSQCDAMYDDWERAVVNMTAEDYIKMKDSFVLFAALASISDATKDSRKCIPSKFLRDADDKEPAGGIHISVMIIDKMSTFRDYITKDTVIDTLINGCLIAYGHLSIYPNLREFMGCYESLQRLNAVVRSTFGLSGVLAETLHYFILPFRMLAEALEKSSLSDEELDKAADYWIENYWDGCFMYFDKAYVLSNELVGANPLSVMLTKKKMKKEIDTMLQVYVSHN